MIKKKVVLYGGEIEISQSYFHNPRSSRENLFFCIKIHTSYG